ncbi:MAG: glycosyltransferase [Candidatus Magnetoovum sp. WYHC-5]|nr:glycosyltransferase [Candidatus Magnetoovum sp. WYHC-5]
MNILIGVHQFFPSHYSGTERYALQLAKQLQKMGHYVQILTYILSEDGRFDESPLARLYIKEYYYEGVPVIGLRHKRFVDNHTMAFNYADEDIYLETKRILMKGNFNIYHCAHPFRIAYSLKAARDTKVKTVLMLTDYLLYCPLGIMLRLNNSICDDSDDGRNCVKYCYPHLGQDVLVRRLNQSRELIDCADRILSPSGFLIELFNHTGLISEGRFILSRHGFDYTKKKAIAKRQVSDTITFGYIGTVQYHKGVHVMVEAFKKTNNPTIRLQVWGGCFGETEYRDKLVEIASADPRITFLGQYEFNDVERIISSMDVVIVPSIWYENAPLTISTSFAFGIPVITTNIGGMGEMVQDGFNGLTFEVGNPYELSIKLNKIAENPDLIEHFRKNIRYPIRIEEEAFNTELVFKELLALS